MKVRDYKSLLLTNRKAAMLFDLTERHPRGPDAKLRAHDYEKHEEYWGNVGAILTLKPGSVPETAEGSVATGGWDPREIWEMEAGEWNLRRMLEAIEVPVEMSMNPHATWGCEEGNALLFKHGAQLTRRARRLASRIRQAKKWVEENITQGIYRVNMGGYRSEDIYVHGESEAGAETQFAMFLRSAVQGIPGFQEDRAYVRYQRPATEPTALMTLNDKFVKHMDTTIVQHRKRIEEMQREIASMEAAREMVYSYSVNMAATYGTDEDECDA